MGTITGKVINASTLKKMFLIKDVTKQNKRDEICWFLKINSCSTKDSEEEEDAEIEAATNLVTRELRRKKVVDTAAL